MPDTTFSAPVVETRAPSFYELGVPEPLCRVLDADGKTEAFPIQADTLPDSLAGRDILGRGRTGSGKTLAFCIPLAARLCEAAWDPDMSMAEFRRNVKHVRRLHLAEREEHGFLPHPRGLILAPTRELANQINDVLVPLAQMAGMTTTTVYGGVKQNRQVRDLQSGADVVVACPGRLEDLLRQKRLTLADVKVVVMDEADEMADMGFLPPVRRILAQIPRESQHMLFSATLDHGVDALVREFLHEPKTHSVDAPEAVVDTMTQHVFEVPKDDKFEVVRQLASGRSRRILFTRTKYQAKKLAKSLTNSGVPAAQLHGNLNQNQRDRNLAAFENGDVNVMVATDVAARGIDVSDVELVVQVDPPDDPKSFVHRSGRTARAGHSGDVVTLVLPAQRREARRMFKAAGIDAKPIQVRHDSPEVQALVGERAAIVKDWSLEDSQPAGNPRRRKAANGESRPGVGRRTGGGVVVATAESHDDVQESDARSAARKRRQDSRRADSAARGTGSPRGSEPRRERRRPNRMERRAGMRDVEAERRERRFETDGARQARRAERRSVEDANHGGTRNDDRNGNRNGNRTRRGSDRNRGPVEGNGGKRIHRRNENRIVQDERSEAAKRHDRRMIAKYGSAQGPARRRANRGNAPFRHR